MAPIEKGDHRMLDEAADTASDLMTRDVAVAQAPDTSLLEAVRLTAQRRISGMPVVDDYGTIVGMMSEGDLIRWTKAMQRGRLGGSICWPTAQKSRRLF
jgi:CBS domain-containing protein